MEYCGRVFQEVKKGEVFQAGADYEYAGRRLPRPIFCTYGCIRGWGIGPQAAANCDAVQKFLPQRRMHPLTVRPPRNLFFYERQSFVQPSGFRCAPLQRSSSVLVWCRTRISSLAAYLMSTGVELLSDDMLACCVVDQRTDGTCELYAGASDRVSQDIGRVEMARSLNLG